MMKENCPRVNFKGNSGRKCNFENLGRFQMAINESSPIGYRFCTVAYDRLNPQVYGGHSLN